jgi:protease-4
MSETARPNQGTKAGPLDADAIVDRRRMRRKLTFWRVATVVVVALALTVGGLRYWRGSATADASGSIARIKITGLIRGDQTRTEALERLAKSQAKAVIVHIDSPGGTTAGSEQLFKSLRALQEQKPMAVVVNGLAASGGYIAAMASDYIVAQDTSLVGSIGVIFQYPNFSQALKTIGIQVEEVKSSPLKAAPNGYEPTSPEARAALEAVVMDSFSWFKGLVQDRRKMDDAQLARVSDGRVFTGRQAVALRLIDALGDEKTAIAWLAKEKQVPADTPVRDYKLSPRFTDLSFLHVAASAFAAIGLGGVAERLESWGAMRAIERLNLDGLLALWHPPGPR